MNDWAEKNIFLIKAILQPVPLFDKIATECNRSIDNLTAKAIS